MAGEDETIAAALAPHLHSHGVETLSEKLKLHHAESQQRGRVSRAEPHHVALCCITDSSSSFLSTVSCPLSLPISLRSVFYDMFSAGTRLADADSSGWQMPAVSADALHQPMTDVRAALGRQHFITLPCSPSSPHWIHQPAWQTQRRPHPTAPAPIPPAPPIYTHTFLHPSVNCYYIRQPSYRQPMDHMLMRPDASTPEI